MIKEGEFLMNAEQGEIERKINVIKLAEGLGFGEGTISVQDRLQSEKDSLNETILRDVERDICSDRIIVPIDVGNNGEQLEDDGCGDGRRAERVYHKHPTEDIVQEKSKSLHRSKVFGGGAVKAAAALVGLGKNTTKSVQDTLEESITMLRINEIPFGAHTDDHTEGENSEIPFGAHTDDHTEGENSGCGAIDKAPQIFSNAVKYEEQIRNTINLLGLETEGIDDVYANFRVYAKNIEEQSYSGRAVLDEIADRGAIVKELGGGHKEVAIVLNTVEGYTVNQEFIREESGDQAQVFATDIRRLETLANRLFSDQKEQQQAFLSMVVYTLATAATLTQGDLPVYIVSEQPQLAVV